jgi:hypothetical protein
MWQVARLGDESNFMDQDFDADNGDGTSSDPRAAYLAWAAAVQSSGGTVTAYPAHGSADAGYMSVDPYGSPAARYPFNTIYPAPSYARNPAFDRAPDSFSADSAYGYYIAPNAVLAYWVNNGITAVQAVPGEQAPGMPDWFNNLSSTLKIGAVVIAGAIVWSLVKD